MSILSLTTLLLGAAALMLLGVRIFLEGSAHLRVHFHSLFRGGLTGVLRLFPEGMLSGLACPGLSVREILWLESCGGISPRAACFGAAGACLPLWLPLAALLPLPWGILLTFAGLVLLMLPLKGDLSVFLGRILAGLGCFVIGAGIFHRYGGLIAASVPVPGPDAGVTVLALFLGACVSFLMGSAEVPCALAVLLCGFNLLPLRTVLFLFAGIFAGSALSRPLFSFSGHPWKLRSTLIYIAHQGVCALFALFFAFVLPSSLSLSPAELSAALLLAGISAASALLLLAALSLAGLGKEDPGEQVRFPVSLAGSLPGLDLGLINAGMNRLGHRIRAWVVRKMLSDTPDQPSPASGDRDELDGDCRTLLHSCGALLCQHPSRREALLCSLCQVAVFCYQEILQSAESPDPETEELPPREILPGRGRNDLLQSVLDQLDQCIYAMNELFLGHPFHFELRENLNALLQETRAIQSDYPENARAALALERILLGIARLGECVESTSARLSEEESPGSLR